MLDNKQILVMRENELSCNEKTEYNLALKMLADEMNVNLSKKRDRNAGEVKSMAMAFAKDFKYFISDDRAARVAAKRRLQKMDGSYLETIQMKDIILQIRKNEKILSIDRKTAKNLYLYGVNPKLADNEAEHNRMKKILEKMKIEFDDCLWPTE
jgi:hypothetical protein